MAEDLANSTDLVITLPQDTTFDSATTPESLMTTEDGISLNTD